MTESEFQQRVTDYCDWLRLLWYHVNDSRRDKAGFPDLVIVGPGGTVFVELKTEKGKVSTKQAEWIAALDASGETALVWRPSDWATAQSILKRIARR